MKRNQAIGLLIVILVLGLGIWGVWKYLQNNAVVEETTNTSTSTETTVSVEDYVKANVSGLSAEAGKPEVLGGKFYVTKVEAHGGAGTVRYEDGHNAYIADFTYDTSVSGKVEMKTFRVR